MIAVTAYSMDGDIERILEAGFDGYLAKPINAMTLVEDVQRIIAETLNKKCLAIIIISSPLYKNSLKRERQIKLLI